jgi:hypothetical protein
MLRKIKFGKIAIVIFLTVLIWVWTDLDLDEEHIVPRATISAAHSQELLVSFSGQPEAVIKNIRLKGPAKKISEKSKQIDNGELDLDFTLNPEREGMTTTGSRTLKVLDFLKRSDKIRELEGLTVEDCEPEIIDVNVVKLVKKPLDIECRDENGVLVNVASINPAKIEMYVPEDSRLRAQVRLSNSHITQARISEAVVLPEIVLAGQTRRATTPVRIKMSPEDDSLREYPIDDARLIFGLSKNLQGRYYVDIDNSNYNELVSFFIVATPEAKQAYEDQPYQLILVILDDDQKNGPEVLQRRDVVYNFPEEYVRRNEIRLRNEPEEAKFKLIPLKPAENPASGTN